MESYHSQCSGEFLLNMLITLWFLLRGNGCGDEEEDLDGSDLRTVRPDRLIVVWPAPCP